MSADAVGDAPDLPALQRGAAALEAIALPVLLSNAEGTQLWLNAAARALEQWLQQGDPGRRLATEVVGALKSLHELPSTLTLTFRRGGGEGGERAFHATFGQHAAAPRHGGLYAITLSETRAGDGELDQARLEEVQRQLLQADRMASIGQLAAGVAHEINNPIGYIQSNLGTLREYVQSLLRLIEAQDGALHRLRMEQPETARQIEDLREQIDFEFLAKDLPTLLAESQEGIARVRKIIQDLRDFSRAGHAEDWSLADIHAGLDSTINIVWNDLKYKVELLKRYGDIPPVECLPSQLNPEILNIQVNAGHAIEQRGQITITTYAEGGMVFIEISDSGKGIPAENLARVFEPFFTTKPIGKGTGLGLSISYGIIKKHNGDIDVRSEVGVGTTFLIKLPVRQPPGTDKSPAAA